VIATDILLGEMKEVAGFVAAGGRSSRMGQDKAWLELGGRPMIEHVISALRPVATSIAVIANDREYSKLGFPVFADTESGIGPLEAIRTALKNATANRILLIGCDLPFVTSELLKFLLSVGENYDVVVPMSDEGKLEPLCAIYAGSALSAVEELIANGHRKISLLFDRVATRFVRFDELEHLRDSRLFFMNVNTPTDYSRALSLVGAGTRTRT
jgi:molybdopterin-guanine dinucleotide biosynthesis protein A